MKEQDESEAIQVVPEVDAREAAVVDVQVTTAKKYPRSLTRAITNAIAIVTRNKAIAETCTYTVPRGGKRISGPSVHLAKIIAQNFGNMRVEARVTGIEGKHVSSTGICWDLESNYAAKVEVTRSIIDKNGKRYSDDLVGVTANAANAIAMRNAIYAVIPKGVIDEVYKAAKDTIVGDVSDQNKLIAKRKEVIDKLKDVYGVTEEEILKAIGKASVEHINSDDLADLIGIGTAIKDGDTTVDAAFRGKQTKEAHDEITANDLADLFVMVKDKMSSEEITDAERIIFKEEKTSYKKLQNRLLKYQEKK